MRTSKLLALLSSVCWLLLPLAAGAGTVTFSSGKDALLQGIGAFKGGYYEQAIPALERAAEDEEFLAFYYLARIYSDNSASNTDHAKAYSLYQKIVDEYADLDPDEDKRAPLVGQSLTALAGYVRTGLDEISLKPDLARAIEYLHNASVIFNDEDAQFELAKLQLTGEGVEEDVPKARHWLSVLTQRGHAGAQAFLADLLWRGKYMAPDQPRALALISIAVGNAPGNEKLWIEDIYQNIYCGAADGLRKQAGGIVAGWGNRYGRKPENRERLDFELLNASPERTCQNGEQVVPLLANNDGATDPNSGSAVARPYMYSSSGAGLRDVAAPAETPVEGPRGDR